MDYTWSWAPGAIIRGIGAPSNPYNPYNPYNP